MPVPVIAGIAAREVLKRAISKALANKAAQGLSAKALVKQVSKVKEVQKTDATKKDIAKELYKFYKKNPKIDTSVKKSYQKDRMTPADVRRERKKKQNVNVAKGISVKAASKPTKPKNSTKVTEKGKATAIASNARAARAARQRAAEQDVPQGITVRGKFYKEPRPGYMGQRRSDGTIKSERPERTKDLPLQDEVKNIEKIIAQLPKAQRDAFSKTDEIVNAFFRKRGMGETISRKEADLINSKLNKWLAKKGKTN